MEHLVLIQSLSLRKVEFKRRAAARNVAAPYKRIKWDTIQDIKPFEEFIYKDVCSDRLFPIEVLYNKDILSNSIYVCIIIHLWGI